MKGIDKLFRARVEDWLAKDSHTEAELAAGALLMLQCNRNQAMYNTVMRRPSRYEERISYELKKHLGYLKDDMSLEDVKQLEKQVLPVIDRVIKVTSDDDESVAAGIVLPSPAYGEDGNKQTDTIVARGKRSDHDTLPEAIRALWDKNAERYKKIKQAHETCKTLTAACDRYEFTSAIAELWDSYKKDFETYDHYVLLPVNEEAGSKESAGEVQLTAEDLKAIGSARAYISKNLPKLLALVAASKKDGFTDDQAKELESWREKIQQRVDVLTNTKQVIKDELRQQLQSADITLEKTDSDEQGEGHTDDSSASE